MATPIIGDLLESTIGKVTDRVLAKFLPESMSEADKTAARLEARQQTVEEYKTAIADVQGARALAMKESEDSPPWTRVLTVTHRPVWSFVMLFIFAFTIIGPMLGLPAVLLTDIHKEIMQTVIVFYFGGRTIEKSVNLAKKS